MTAVIKMRWKTDEWLRQETFCHRQWTDEYVERPGKLLYSSNTWWAIVAQYKDFKKS